MPLTFHQGETSRYALPFICRHPTLPPILHPLQFTPLHSQTGLHYHPPSQSDLLSWTLYMHRMALCTSFSPPLVRVSWQTDHKRHMRRWDTTRRNLIAILPLCGGHSHSHPPTSPPPPRLPPSFIHVWSVERLWTTLPLSIGLYLYKSHTIALIMKPQSHVSQFRGPLLAPEKMPGGMKEYHHRFLSRGNHHLPQDQNQLVHLIRQAIKIQ